MSQKVLFFTQQGLVKNDGASEKVFAQRNAITHLGYDTRLAYVDGTPEGWQLHVDDKLIAVDSNYKGLYTFLYEYVKKKKIDYMYIRYGANACYEYNCLLKRVAREGVKIYIEIPTYPYDGEYHFSSLKALLQRWIERYFRNRWKGIVHRIVTFSVDKEIYGVPTVIIHNCSARELPVKRLVGGHDGFNMLAVANLAFWHGYDRIIRGLANYYKSNPSERVDLYVAGRGNEQIYNELVSLTKALNIDEYVHFVGSKSSVELDQYFETTDLAIGCLACHRKKVYEVKSLKNVEYAMRGVPMVYSENNTDFDGQEYVFKVPADESDINVKSLINFVSQLKLTPQEIHDTVKDFMWDKQMRKVFDS